MTPPESGTPEARAPPTRARGGRARRSPRPQDAAAPRRSRDAEPRASPPAPIARSPDPQAGPSPQQHGQIDLRGATERAPRADGPRDDHRNCSRERQAVELGIGGIGGDHAASISLQQQRQQTVRRKHPRRPDWPGQIANDRRQRVGQQVGADRRNDADPQRAAIGSRAPARSPRRQRPPTARRASDDRARAPDADRRPSRSKMRTPSSPPAKNCPLSVGWLTCRRGCGVTEMAGSATATT